MAIKGASGKLSRLTMENKPVEITEFSDTTLLIVWDDGHESIYLYEDLRQICPCASCTTLREKSRTGKLPFKKKIPMGSKTASIMPERIENVGHYAIKFLWNDKHDTGIYTFDFLRENCTCEECNSS